MTRTDTSLFSLPLAPAYDPARWAEAAYDVWQGSYQPTPTLVRRSQKRLHAMVDYARTASPFYAQRYARLPDTTRLRLTDLPPVTKRELMDDFDRVVTRAGVTRHAVEEFIKDPAGLGTRLLGRYSVWTSSGTTGQPGLFVHDPDALAVYDALEAQRFRGMRSATDLARQFIESDRYVMVAATSGHFAGISTVERVRRVVPWLAPIMKGCSLLQPIERLVSELNEFAPTLLATYPTAADMLATQQQAGHLRLQLRELWTGGEYLAPAARARLQQVFNCRVRNGYGASEFLPIAWECPHRTLHINSDWVILEPVDANGLPVPLGVRSHTVLLTNLANRVQPLIRYDLGDSITLSPRPCDCGSAFPAMTVEGRQDDSLQLPHPNGDTVSVVPLALATVLEDDACVHDFQVTQTAPRKVSVRLGQHEAAPPRSVRRVLNDYFGALGVEDIAVDIVRTAPVRDARSGKLRRVICELPAGKA
jgi:phenylacetate-CoA ligase